MRKSFDVAVIGAGPAGCAAAMYLAKCRLRVALLDKSAFPRPKACGEGIMPSGASVLVELGLLGGIAREGRCFEGIAFNAADGTSARGKFPHGRLGVAIPRDRLDPLLFARARAAPGIEAFEQCRDIAPVLEEQRLSSISVTRESGALSLAAEYFLIADGANSSTLRRLGIPREIPARRRFGLSAHFSAVDVDTHVNVFFFDRGEAYVASQKDGTALVSFLVEEDALRQFRGDGDAIADHLANRSGLFFTRMARAKRSSPWLGGGPLGGSSARWFGPRWLAIGDAASSVDPIIGDGIALALRDAQSAARLAAEAFGGVTEFDRIGPRFVKERGARLAKKRLKAEVLLALARRPPFSRSVLSGLRGRPRIFSRLLADC